MIIQGALLAAGGNRMLLPAKDPVVADFCMARASNFPTLVDEIFYRRIYERIFTEPRGKTFLDLGANIGLVSLFASDVCARIVAVEPDPETFVVLKAMTCQFSNIECVQAALAPKDGEVTFYRNPENFTASSTVNTFGNKTSVPGLTLESILSIYQLEQVHVCKVDVEGAEELALTADHLMKARNIVDCWWIETHNTPTCRWEDSMCRLTSTLDFLGYTKQEIKGMRLIAERKT